MDWIAVISPGHDTARPDWLASLDRLPEFSNVFSKGNTDVWARVGTPVAQISDYGVTLGEVFNLKGAAANSLATFQRDALASALISQYWGAYVAVAAPNGSGYVLRDPSGACPCYWTLKDGHLLIFSEVETVARLGIITMAVDRPGIAYHLLWSYAVSPATCLSGVAELLPGTRIQLIGGAPVLDQLWSPWTFAGNDVQFKRFEDARDAVRAAVDLSVKTWARNAGTVFHQLSGGLDSSIVGVSLGSAGANVVPATLVLPNAVADERSYARLVAEALGADLISVNLTFNRDVFRTSGHRLFPRPRSGLLHDLADAAFFETAKTHSVGAFFGGNGGDSVFCKLNTAGPVADSLLAYGLGRQTDQVIGDLVTLHNVTRWRAGWWGLKKVFRRKRFFPEADLQYLSASARCIRAPEGARPQIPHDVAPGKVDHVRSIVGALQSPDQGRREAIAPIREPLLSQPVIEACLRVPTWMWIRGGEDRAVARQAFDDLLPEKIRRRSTKGDFSYLNAEIARSVYPELKPLLLGGHLMGMDLLDAEALKSDLSKPAEAWTGGFNRLLRLANSEIWCRQVLSR